MLGSAIQVNVMLIKYGQSLVGDIADERFAEQPVAGVNHPAWILGHLALTADSGLELLGAPKALHPEWTTLFARGSKPSRSRGDYASKDELVRAFEHGYEQLRKHVRLASPEQLSRPSPHEQTRATLPTLSDVIALLLTGHVGTHLGQLSAWRRLIGLPPLF
jgi:hypothetical protein